MRRIKLEEHQRTVRATLLHVNITGWLLGVVAGAPNSRIHQLPVVIGFDVKLTLQ